MVQPALSPIPPLVLARFAAADWAVLGGYFVILIITGWWFSRRKQTGTEDYFLGGRQMPVWAVAISILATTQSAATFIGAPEQSYVGNLTYLSSNIGMVLAALVVAFVFIPRFYRLKVATPYEMLRGRFGEGAVEATSHAYIFGRILASGSRVYIAAIPVALIAFGSQTSPTDWLRDHWAAFDSNKDKIVTFAEVDSARALALPGNDAHEGEAAVVDVHAAGAPSPLAGFIREHTAEIDLDQDGQIAASELEAGVSAIFSGVDVNADGEIHAGETGTPRWQIMLGIVILSLVGIFYTLIGGIRSVIWTDVIQCVVYVGATAVAVYLLLDRIPAGPGAILEALRSGGPGGTSKLTVIDPGIPFNASAPYTIFTAVIGFTLLGTASYGTDHDMVQRMLTCNSAKKGAWTAITGIVVGIPVVLLFMVVGLLLWVFYQRPDLMGAEAPAYAAGESRTVFLDYILRELPAGLSGLMLAGLFAAGLSSVNSTLNAMSSAFTNNFYKHYVVGRDDQHYLKVGRLGVVGFGVILGGFACACVFLQQSSTLIDFALSVMNFAYAGLLAVFFTALFTRRGNTGTVIAALLVGAFVVLLMQPWIWPLWTGLVARALPAAAALPELKLAFPWQLLIAVTVAFVVCVSGSPVEGRSGGGEVRERGPLVEK